LQKGSSLLKVRKLNIRLAENRTWARIKKQKGCGNYASRIIFTREKKRHLLKVCYRMVKKECSKNGKNQT
jgi:hypothetical protein